MKVHSLIHLTEESLIDGAGGAFDRAFDKLVLSELEQADPIINAFAKSSKLSEKGILSLYSQIAHDSKCLISNDVILLTASQIRELLSAQRERSMQYSPKRTLAEGSHGALTHLMMGPPLAKHGFGFWRKEIEGHGHVFSTISLPDKICKALLEYDRQSRLANSMMEAFSTINHDWLHQVTVSMFNPQVSGMLDREGMEISEAIMSKHASSFDIAWERATGKSRAQTRYFINDPYESWISRSHGMALHLMMEDKRGRDYIESPIVDYFKNLKKVCDLIKIESPEEAASFYNFGFDFLAFNYARAFTAESPITGLIFEHGLKDVADYDIAGHTARQVYMATTGLRIRNGEMMNESSTIHSIRPEDMAEKLSAILALSSRAEDRDAHQKVAEIKTSADLTKMPDFFIDVGIGFVENPAAEIMTEQVILKSLWCKTIARLCIDGTNDFGPNAHAFIILMNVGEEEQRLAKTLKELAVAAPDSDAILKAKMDCYLQTYRDMNHIHALSEKEAASISREFIPTLIRSVNDRAGYAPV